jgi:hypothetical protein
VTGGTLKDLQVATKALSVELDQVDAIATPACDLLSSSANAPVVHVIGDFFAYVCQFEEFFYGKEILVPFG